MADFLRDLINKIKDEDTTVASDRKSAGEVAGYIDTGCYMLNALLSGSLYGGLPDNRITGLVGECMPGDEEIEIFVTQETKEKYNI